MSYEPPHPIEAMAFFQASAAEITEMKAIYDGFVGSDPALKSKLDRLIEWAGQQAACDEAYNNTDFSS